MSASTPGDHFDHLSTSWTLLANAHDPAASPEHRNDARRQLLQRYQSVVRRYLAGALRGAPGWEDAVDECVQELSVRMMSGAFHGATPERGRFRHYLRSCLSNLVTDYRRRQQRQGQALGDFEPAAADQPLSEQDFLALWREELVGRALRALEEFERQSGQLLYTVLKLKMDQPELRSAQIAERLGGGQALTEGWARKRLFRAREKLTELLRAEVRQSLREPDEAQVDEELAEVGLLEYCRPLPSEGR